MPGIISVYQLYGLYYLRIMVEVFFDQAVKSIIADNLRSKAGVVSTITMKILS